MVDVSPKAPLAPGASFGSGRAVALEGVSHSGERGRSWDRDPITFVLQLP